MGDVDDAEGVGVAARVDGVGGVAGRICVFWVEDQARIAAVVIAGALGGGVVGGQARGIEAPCVLGHRVGGICLAAALGAALVAAEEEGR